MSDKEKPVVPVGGGVPFDPETGKRYGWLPPRAAGRKLVIRAQLGLPWVLGALAAALLLLVAGVVFVVARPDRPGPPYADEGPLAQYAEQDVTPLSRGSAWVDRRRGLDVFVMAAFCVSDGGWIGPGGPRFDEAGRSETGTGAYRARVKVVSGRLYVDLTRQTRVTGQTEPLPPCDVAWLYGEPRPADGA